MKRIYGEGERVSSEARAALRLPFIEAIPRVYNFPVKRTEKQHMIKA